MCVCVCLVCPELLINIGARLSMLRFLLSIDMVSNYGSDLHQLLTTDSTFCTGIGVWNFYLKPVTVFRPFLWMCYLCLRIKAHVGLSLVDEFLPFVWKLLFTFACQIFLFFSWITALTHSFRPKSRKLWVIDSEHVWFTSTHFTPSLKWVFQRQK